MTIMHSMYRESGKVSIDCKACTQCGACAMLCPAEVLQIKDGTICIGNDSPFGCIACGHCMMVCPEGAIKVTGRGTSPEDLLPLPEKKKAGAEELLALMQSRRSVRKFTEQNVEAEVLNRIVEMASTGPMGIPPWDVGVVTIQGREEVGLIAGEVIRGYERFLKIFKPWLLKTMRPFIGKSKYEMFAHFVLPLAKIYVRGHRQGRDMLFYDAPSLLIFHHSPYADAADATIACTYAMLAAESLGLGSTIIGGATPILKRNKTLCMKLGIPSGNEPSIVLILGYPATHFRRIIRRQFTTS